MSSNVLTARKLIAALLLVVAAATAYGTEPRIAIIYDGGESTGPVEIHRANAALSTPASLSIYAPGRGGLTLESDDSLSDYDLILVDADTEIAQARRALVTEAGRQTRLAVVNSHAGLAGNMGEHPDLDAYWANKSQANFRSLLSWLIVQAGGPQNNDIDDPIIYPEHLFHHPDAPTQFSSRGAFMDWYRQSESGNSAEPGALNIGLAFHFNNLAQEDIAQVDATIRAIELAGHNALPLAGAGPVAFDPHFLDDDGNPVIDVALVFGQRLDFHDYEAGLAQARALGITMLSAFSHRGMDAQQYADSRTGLAPTMTSAVVAAERDGIVEPFVVGARSPSRHDRHFVEPMGEQIQWRVERAVSWARLARLANDNKRIVVTYWSEAGGQADLGGDPDDFLDVPASLVAWMHDLRDQGYWLGDEPIPERDELTRRMIAEGANIGSWSQGRLDELVASGRAVLLPEQTYLDWFRTLPEDRQQEIESLWGPPPGQIMVHENAAGERSLVLPGIEFGNLRLAPHPAWGYLESEAAMMSRDQTPPHHQYLAFFLWLQQDWQADAWVSLFSNIVLQPGRAEGPLANDHIGILLGDLVHIHPERLGANGGIKNKRKGLASTPGWYNIVVPSGELEALQSLRSYLLRLDAVASEDGRSALESLIRQEIIDQGLDRALGPGLDSISLDQLVLKLQAYLSEMARSYMPHGTKVLGESASGRALADMVAGMLGPDFRRLIQPHVEDAHRAAGDVVAEVLRGRSHRQALAAVTGVDIPAAHEFLDLVEQHAGNLQAAPRERQAIVDLLAGRYIEPGSIDEPIRRPDSVPPGRQLYHFDPATMPTPEAEVVGRAQARNLIAAHLEDHDNEHPRQMAFVLWSSDTTRNHGITEAQVLDLLGVRAVRDSRGVINGVELIDRDELGRPRIDVLITASGTYRDHFPGLMELITEAVALAATSPEPDNAVANAVDLTEAELIRQGLPAERAAQLARVRVFSEAPGAYSPNIQFLARSGDQRGDEARMADLYIERLSHAYGGDFTGQYERPTFEQNLTRTDGAVLPRSNNVNALLDDPMPAGYLGGLNLAVRAVTGSDTTLYISDLRDLDQAQMQSAARMLQSELRTRYFNPAWIRQMTEHGYDGARSFMFLTEQLDLWNSTTSQMVSSADWDEVKSVFVDDRFELGLNEFFDQYNPWAQQMLMVNLLGAAERGHWQASEEDLAEVASQLVESTLAHGPACEPGQCRNSALTAQIETVLADLPDMAPAMAAYQSAVSQAQQAAPSASSNGDIAQQVTGRVMETQSAPGATEARLQPELFWLVIAFLAVVLLLAGWFSAGRTD